MPVPKTPEFEAAVVASRKLASKPSDDELLEVRFINPRGCEFWLCLIESSLCRGDEG